MGSCRESLQNVREKEMTHTPEWYARSLAWCDYCLALAQRRHTDDELRMAEMALAVHPESRQPGLFKGIDHAANVR